MSAQYYIMKSTRYSHGQKPSPYTGPSCDSAGIERGKTYLDFSEACNDADALTECNPVGFCVINTDECAYWSDKQAPRFLQDDLMWDKCPACNGKQLAGEPPYDGFPGWCTECSGRGAMVVPRTRPLPTRS